MQGALNLAGGLLPTAYMPASRIERITDAGEKTLVNLDLTSRSGREFRIKDADVIQIHTTLDTMRDIVKLEGHVKRPGGFAWRKGIRFTDVVPSVDDMLANPDIDVGLILREEKARAKYLCIYLHLQKRSTTQTRSTTPSCSLATQSCYSIMKVTAACY